MPVKPITPNEVSVKAIPEAVIEAFNKLIMIKFDGSQSHIKQKEAVSAIMKNMKLKDSKKIFDNHWLDVEPIFRKAGWKVTFDNPGFNETYEPSFIFKKK